MSFHVTHGMTLESCLSPRGQYGDRVLKNPVLRPAIAKSMAQSGAGGSKTVGTRQRAVKDRIEDRNMIRGKLTAEFCRLSQMGNSKAHSVSLLTANCLLSFS